MSSSPFPIGANDSPNPDRRKFLAALTTAAGGALAVGLNNNAIAQDAAKSEEPAKTADKPLLDSPPVLQNPTPTGMSIAWAVNGPAAGWVEYGETEELGKRVDAGPINGLNAVADRMLSVRIEGLSPGATVHYKVASAPIHYKNAYEIKRGETQASPVYQFTTPTDKAETATFVTINDTHENDAVLKPLTAQIAEEPADFTIWNGDVFNDIRSIDQLVAQTLRPAGAAYATTRPVLFTSGNHDVRGSHARALPEAFCNWPGQGPLGRSFAVRQGPLALIGLDTGEDKPDRHPVFAGLAAFEPYREAQGEWLKQTFARPDIKSAPFVVVFCHIPLWGRPGENAGDSLEGYASYCGQAQRAWHPTFVENKIHLLICAHMHQYRVDAPTAERPYPQIVGGGPRPNIATMIRGKATAEQLEVTASSLDKKVLGSWKFTPRTV